VSPSASAFFSPKNYYVPESQISPAGYLEDSCFFFHCTDEFVPAIPLVPLSDHYHEVTDALGSAFREQEAVHEQVAQGNFLYSYLDSGSPGRVVRFAEQDNVPASLLGDGVPFSGDVPAENAPGYSDSQISATVAAAFSHVDEEYFQQGLEDFKCWLQALPEVQDLSAESSKVPASNDDRASSQGNFQGFHPAFSFSDELSLNSNWDTLPLNSIGSSPQAQPSITPITYDSPSNSSSFSTYPSFRSSCTICGKTCASGAALRKHAKIHMKASRKFKCTESLCTANFYYAKDLYRHKETKHSDTVKYFCPKDGCEYRLKGFKRKDGLMKHVRKLHKHLH